MNPQIEDCLSVDEMKTEEERIREVERLAKKLNSKPSKPQTLEEQKIILREQTITRAEIREHLGIAENTLKNHYITDIKNNCEWFSSKDGDLINTEDFLRWVEAREIEKAKPQKTALYRHLNANGELLYIGVSNDMLRRNSQPAQRQMVF